ncbi:MAG: magnesium/cobalt transporter CorA [Fluviicola sp.]|jgi:magnesium transporter|nr:magnesium/cobalt transporter CorA [Fluviicola sp.]
MDSPENICQIYKYDKEFFLLAKNSPEYFAKEFVSTEISDDKVVWLNYHGLSDRENIERLCDTLNVDRLSVEDIYKEKNRPKLEEYPNYLFFSVRSALPDEKNVFILEQDQVSFILGKNYLISFQGKSSDHFIEVRGRIEKKRGKIRSKGADFLLFRMLEAIIDNYFEVLEHITETIEEIEVKMHQNANTNTLKLIELQKRKLIELRKIVVPLKDVTSQLEKTNSHLLENENHYYFTDLKENCLSVLEEIDVNKQILDGMANLYYAVQGQKMNQIMKILTIVSSVFIPLTFIVGVYGMNFENMPELKYKYGYYTVVGVMFVIAISLIIYFKRNGWLKKQ